MDYMNRQGALHEALMNKAISILNPGEQRTLASGKIMTAGYYADLRRLVTLPRALELLANEIFLALPDTTKYLGAVPTGGLLPLGAVGYALPSSGRWHRIKLFYVRGAKKDHGTKQLVEGYLAHDGPAVMLEDVVSTGGSLIEAIAAARVERNADIRTAICILDREMGGREQLEAIGVELRPLFTASGLGLPQCTFA